MSFPTIVEGGGKGCFGTLALAHTWPLWDRSQHFELGYVLSSLVTDAIRPGRVGDLGVHHAGCWECDLADNSLVWSGGVYDIFGLQRGVDVCRDDAVGFYSEASRAKMECLRQYSIKHKRGFTLDVEIRPAIGGHRRIRLIAEPLISNGRVSRLQGLKLVI